MANDTSTTGGTSVTAVTDAKVSDTFTVKSNDDKKPSQSNNDAHDNSGKADKSDTTTTTNDVNIVSAAPSKSGSPNDKAASKGSGKDSSTGMTKAKIASDKDADNDKETTESADPAEPADPNAELASQLEERLIHQEYKIWKKNTPYLYDFVMTHGLEWPSLTVQWLPSVKTLNVDTAANSASTVGGASGANGANGANGVNNAGDGGKEPTSDASEGVTQGVAREVGAVGGTSKNVAEEHSLLIGTHTTGEQNYLMVASVNLPREDVVIDNRALKEDKNDAKSGEGKSCDAKSDGKSENGKDGKDEGGNPNKKQKTDSENSTNAATVPGTFVATNYNEEKNELGGYSFGTSASSSSSSKGLVGKIEIRMKIPHDGEVNRARYAPQNHFVVATRGPSPEVYVWDLSRHSSFPTEGGMAAPNPQVVCKGHTGEGYGLAWCPAGLDDDGNDGGTNGGANGSAAYRFCTSAEDQTVRIWNVTTALSSHKNHCIVHPEATLRYHTSVVEDVDWHKRDLNMIGSCGDDRRLCFWDVREGKYEKPVSVVEEAHEGDVNSLAFHLTKEFLVVSGSADKMVKLWDLRNLKSPLQTLKGHTDQVYTTTWSPFHESILATSSADRRVAIWDLSRIGAEQSPEDAEDGPPELLFLHGGHTSKVSDVSWNGNYDWCCASVSEDNVLQVWSPAEEVWADGGEEDGEEGEEGDGGDGDEDMEDLAMKKRTEILGDDELE